MKRWTTMAAVAVAMGCLLAAGCATVNPERPTDERGYAYGTLRPGDQVGVIFGGLADPPPASEQRIKENGTISLPHIGDVKAAGKKRGELEHEIRELYVSGGFYRPHLSVTVRTENRVFYVRGEVNSEGRHPYLGEMTVTRAIAAAGGFTDFAKKSRVELIRSTGQRYRVDVPEAEVNPTKDLAVYPDDLIVVPRRLW